MALYSMTLNGSDVTDHIISYERTKNICSAIGTLTIESSTLTPDPWDTFVLREDGRKKGTYYVSSIEKSAIPGSKRIQCQDGSKRIADYFIADIYNINYASYARYWIEKFLTEAGVTYEFNTTSNGALLSENFALGPSTAFEIITTLLQNSGWYMYFDENNKCIIGTLNIDLTGPVKARVNANTIITLKVDKNDSMLRNRAVVWGIWDTESSTWVFADVSQPTAWDRNEHDIRTVLLSNSCVRNYGTAYDLAAKILNEFGKLNNEKSLEVAGEVNLDLGDIVKVNTKYYKGECLVTTVGSRCSSSGLITNLILDQRCPRLFGYVSYLDYVYVGTDGAGVWRKPLDSGVWESFSTGLSHDGVDNYNVSDLIIKNGIFSCVANGVAYINTERIADWHFVDPLYLLDQDSYSYPTGSFEAVGTDIDEYSNNIVIGYRLLAPLPSGEYRSWIVEVSPDLEILSRRQIFVIDKDHQDFRLVDTDRYAAKKLGAAEAPFSYAPSDPEFWGERKVYPLHDPEPHARTLGPPPECATYFDPLVTNDNFNTGGFYEDSSSIIDGPNAISGFWSWGWYSWFTYEVYRGETRYDTSLPIEWPKTYGIPFEETNNWLVSRIVYRQEDSEDKIGKPERNYHVCDIVKANGIYTLDHYEIQPLLYGTPYKVRNCDLATTGNITLSGEQTIDGHNATFDMRILVKDQTDAKENGIYYVRIDTWERAYVDPIDADLRYGLFVMIDNGDVNWWTGWQASGELFPVIGTDDITFERVLYILSSSSQYLVSSSDWFVYGTGPYDAYYDLVPKMRNGVIYWLVAGHVQEEYDAGPPGGNPFAVKVGHHQFKAISYDIFNRGLTISVVYDSVYTTDIAGSIKFHPSVQTYALSELIACGTGYGALMFEYTRYPEASGACSLVKMLLTPGASSATSDKIWEIDTCEDIGTEECGSNPCVPTVQGSHIPDWPQPAIAATGYIMGGFGDNNVRAYAKYRFNVSSELLYICCLPGGDCFADQEVICHGVVALNSGSIDIVEQHEAVKGNGINACHAEPFDNWTAADYAEQNVYYPFIQPLQIREGSIAGDCAFVYNGQYLYRGSESWTYINALEHVGLISPIQDDFSCAIYVFELSSQKIYGLSAFTGTTLFTLDTSIYEFMTWITEFLYTNGYFMFIHNAYHNRVDGMAIYKLKNDLLFPGEKACFLMDENPTEGIMRGLDYTIRDVDFFDLELESSQEYPLLSWTTPNILIIYSGCDGIIYSGAGDHLKHYNIELGNTVLSGKFNDARVFSINGSFITDDGVYSAGYGKYIGVTVRDTITTAFTSSESTSGSEFELLHSLSGIAGKLEFSNALAPYIFISTSGVGFFQRNPGSGTWHDYSPAVFSSEITTIRLDDRI